MKTQRNTIYSFEDYVVEAGERRLWRHQELVPITPKAFDTLITLLARRGRVVEKEFFLNEVWPDTFVEESTLATNISTIRKILGTQSNGKQFIETVSRHGYRFSAEVKEIINDEEILVLQHKVRTGISAEQEKLSTLPWGQPETNSASKEVSLAGTPASWLRPQKWPLVVFPLVFGLIIVIVFGSRLVFHSTPLSATGFKQIEFSQLTSNGNVSLITISPDGDYLALVETNGETETLLLRQIDNSATVEIVPPKKQMFIGLSFSPDSNYIYYVTYDLEKTPGQADSLKGKLFKVPLLGGPPTQISTDINSPIAISPDGNQFAFIRYDVKEDQTVLIVSSFDTKEEKKLSSRRLIEQFSTSDLSWSPDAKTIAVAAFTAFQGESRMNIFLINAANGEQQPLTSKEWQFVANPKWLGDGSGIIFSAFNTEADNQTDEIWEVSYPQGEVRKITGGIRGAYGLGLTNNSKVMAAVKSDRLSSFWTSSLGNLKQAAKITQNLTVPYLIKPGVSWTPDGKIVFGSTLNGNPDIWIMNSDGSNRKQITTDSKTDLMPEVSADGQYIFFISNRTGRRNIWRMRVDGSEQKQITDQEGVFSPSLPANGQTLYYSAEDRFSQKPFLHKISVDGGESVQITSAITMMPKISPDGKWIACYFPASSQADPPGDLKLTVLSSENGQVWKQFGIFEQKNRQPISWLDNQTLSYVTRESDGSSSLWLQRLDKNEPQMILDSPTDLIFRFAWSQDGQNLIYEKGVIVNDVILIKSVSEAQ